MESTKQATLAWQVNEQVLSLEGELVRNTLSSLHAHKKQLANIEQIDITGLLKIDSAGLALIAQIALQSYPLSIKVKGANRELCSLIDAYKLPLELI